MPPSLDELAAPPSILVVDDDMVMRRVVSAHLAGAGFAVESAANGVEAWEALGETGGGYDLVITDIDMPEMNGVELIQRINRELPSLPVVVMTGVGDKALVIDLLRLGVGEYLDKPFEKEDLLAVARKQLTGSVDGHPRQQLRLLRREMQDLVRGQVADRTRELISWIRGGVKHRFNQPLTVLNANLALLKRLPPEAITDEAFARLWPEVLTDLRSAAGCITDLVTLLSRMETVESESYLRDERILDLEASAREAEPHADGAAAEDGTESR